MTWATIGVVEPLQQKAWRAGRFWWDWPRPSDSTTPSLQPTLQAVIFDLDAIADSLEDAVARLRAARSR